MDEKIYYSEGGVQISLNRAVFGNVTYQVANITSVTTTQNQETKRDVTGQLKKAGCLTVTLCCACPALWTLFMLAMQFRINDEMIITMLVIPAILTAVGIGVLRSMRIASPIKIAHFHLMIETASGSAQAWTNTNAESMTTVVAALNSAIADRHSDTFSTTLEHASNTEGSKEMKTCPVCAEDVKGAAKKCRYCGHLFEVSFNQ
jgi:hypothetical protein